MKTPTSFINVCINTDVDSRGHTLTGLIANEDCKANTLELSVVEAMAAVYI